ncbi:hypothetical protein FQZ97_1245220 [compost metagenome]
MQNAQHVIDRDNIVAMLVPAAHGSFHGFQQVVGLLQEDVEDVRFVIVLLRILVFR